MNVVNHFFFFIKGHEFYSKFKPGEQEVEEDSNQQSFLSLAMLSGVIWETPFD